MTEELPDAKYLRTRAVKARYGGITDMSLSRWLSDPDSDFPHPIVIAGRRFWLISELDAFDERAVERARTAEKARKARAKKAKSSPVNAAAAG